MNHNQHGQSRIGNHLLNPGIRWLFLLALTLSALIAPAGPVIANQEDFASYWKLTFDFTNDFNGKLQIDMGYNDGNGGVKAPALVSEAFPVACQRVGSVGLSGGSALFTGGYLQCQLDVKSAIAELTLACKKVDASCEITVDDHHIYQHLHMAASVYSTATGIAPLFYHPDAHYTALVTSMSSTALKTTLTNMGTIQSTVAVPSPVLNNWLDYQADYDCNACEMNFEIAGVTENVPVGPDAQVSFYTPASTIYIGYNPDSGYVIPSNTAIDFLAIDPPNAGSGG